MNGLTKFGGTLGVALGMVLLSASTLAPSYAFTPASKLWVEGTSTVQNYTCRAGDLAGSVNPTDPAAALAIADLGTPVRSAEATLGVAALECGNGTMNSHMRKALKSDQNPTISYKLTSHEVVAPGSNEATVRLAGTLTMAGQTRPISMDATASNGAGGELRVKGSKEIIMSEWGIKPPSLMMGTMKVRDKVTVHFDVAVGR